MYATWTPAEFLAATRYMDAVGRLNNIDEDGGQVVNLQGLDAMQGAQSFQTQRVELDQPGSTSWTWPWPDEQ